MREQQIFQKALRLFGNDEEKALLFLEIMELSNDIHACKFPDVEMVIPPETPDCEYCIKGQCFYRAPDSILTCSAKNCPLINF